MIERCPVCDYSLEGLPVAHTCPECGFGYEKQWDVVRTATWVRSAALVYCVIAFGAVIGYFFWRNEYAWTLILAGSAIASVLIQSPVPTRFALVNRDQVRMFSRGVEVDRFDIRATHRAVWSWVDGGVYVYEGGGRKRLEIPYRFFRSHGAMRRLARSINRNVAAAKRNAGK